MAKRKKNRRIKKTKYLSLTSLRFPDHDNYSIHHRIPLPTTTTTSTTHHHHHHHHHHHLVDDNMDYLLSSASDDGDATTLTALLLDSSSSAADLPVVVPNSDDGPDHELPSVSYVSEAINLVRTALRSRERDSSTTPHHHVERYVRYSEVVDDRRDHEEVSSRVGATLDRNEMNEEPTTTTMLMRRRRLALKLDYQEIIKAWSDKGGFYVSPSCSGSGSGSGSEYPPQTVPDVIHHQFFCHPPFTYGGGLWSVPEGNVGPMSMLKMKEEEMEEEAARVPQDYELEQQHRTGVGAEEEWKWKVAAPGQREASVLRYKEKRRNRLFSKTIRYQVRKENAQKRPRVKGRFVKRS